MSLSDNLIPNETVLFQAHKHWVAPIRASLVAIGLILIAGLLGIIKPSGDGFLGWIGSVLGLIQGGLVIAGGVWIAYNIVLWRTAQFAVTNLRVLRYEGLIRRRTSETLLSSVTDVRVVVGLLGRQLGYGDLRIVTGAGEAAADSFIWITQPLEFRNAMMARRMAAEVGGDASASVAAAPVAAATTAPAPDTDACGSGPGGRRRHRRCGSRDPPAGRAPGPGPHLGRGVRGEEARAAGPHLTGPEPCPT